VTEQELLDLIAQAREEEWEELDLAGLGLEVLPPEIGSLVKLKRLVLDKIERLTNLIIIGHARTS
jgi:internalin A